MTSVSVKNVSVNYHLDGSISANIATHRPALSNISFELREGDRLGLIGDNGAGKTTLLKVISGVLPPTAGVVHTRGTVSALMAIHVGMFENLSGYQNILSRCRFMGLSEYEIENHIDDIVDFTELADKLNEPIRTYSAGMRLRLAFAVATAFDPDILVMDEWLSAGDAKFRKKARGRLERLISNSGIFTFASHSEGLQKQMCNKGVVLQAGEMQFSGSIGEAWAFANQNL